VEMGSGMSTVWIAGLLAGRDLRLVSLEHDEDCLQRTSEMLVHAGVRDKVDLRFAPLVMRDVDGEEHLWYSNTDGLDDVALLVVDGPPKATSRLARFPAVPLLAPVMADGALVILDDAQRSVEKEISQRWQDGQWCGRRFVLDRRIDRCVVLRALADQAAVLTGVAMSARDEGRP